MITTTEELLKRLEKLEDVMSTTLARSLLASSSEVCGDTAAMHHQLTIQAAHNFIKNTAEKNAMRESIGSDISDQISDSQDNLIGTLEVLGNQLSRSIDYLTQTINRK